MWIYTTGENGRFTCAGHASPGKGLGAVAAPVSAGGGHQDPLLRRGGRGQVSVVVGETIHFTSTYSAIWAKIYRQNPFQIQTKG
jgi:hypothetical protein